MWHDVHAALAGSQTHSVGLVTYSVAARRVPQGDQTRLPMLRARRQPSRWPWTSNAHSRAHGRLQMSCNKNLAVSVLCLTLELAAKQVAVHIKGTQQGPGALADVLHQGTGAESNVMPDFGVQERNTHDRRQGEHGVRLRVRSQAQSPSGERASAGRKWDSKKALPVGDQPKKGRRRTP